MVYACALSRIFNYRCGEAKALIDRFPLPSSVFSLSKKELKDIFGPKSSLPDELLETSVIGKAVAEVEWTEKFGVRVIYIGDSTYPRRLKECNDAPLVLFYKGTADLNHSRIISFVGTRRPTPYGKEMCRMLVKNLASLEAKPVIVSGLAYGIDICAHRTALECGLETIGVMATGIDEIYPALHRADAVNMVANGGVITDFPHQTPSIPVNFLRRNRIIAGMSDATVLVESDADGGGVITSKMAASYNRDVFAVPGRMDDKYSEGPNLLIRDQVANMITEPDRVANALGWGNKRVGGSCRQGTLFFESDNEIKRNILLALSSRKALDMDSVITVSNADYKDIMCAVTELELEGRIRQEPDGRYISI